MYVLSIHYLRYFISFVFHICALILLAYVIECFICEIKKCVQDFYIEAAVQIRKRFPLGDPVIKMLRVLDPKTSMSFLPSLVPLASRFSNILPESKIQQLDSD